MPRLSHDKLLFLAKITGGVATLVLAALFISGTPSNSRLAAAVVCSGGTTCTSTSGTGSVSLSLAGTGLTKNGDDSVNISAGQTFTLTWPIPTGGVQDGTTFNCFGNGTACGTSFQTLQLGATAPTYSSLFTTGGYSYLTTAESNDGNVKVFRWISGSNCFGDGTTCGTSYQSFLAACPRVPYTFTAGGNTFLAVGAGSTAVGSCPGGANTLTSFIYKWMPTQYAEGSQPVNTSAGFAGYTMVDRSWQLRNNNTVTQIGTYSSSAAAITVKIVKRNSAGNYDIVVSQSCAHPGNGWYDCTLTTPFVVPATGTYYAGVYSAGNMGATIANVARAYLLGDTTGTGKIFSEDTNSTDVVRAVYQTAVSNTPCFGDGVECVASNETVLGENAFQSIGSNTYTKGDPAWAILTDGGSTYLTMSNADNVTATNARLYVFKWMPTIYSEWSGPKSASVGNTGYTLLDRSWQVDNSNTVTKVGAYSTSAATITVKLLKRNSAGNYDIVVSQSCAHPGNGWYDCTLTTPFVVPATGTYYAGVYANINMGLTSTNVLRSYVLANVTGTAQTLTEDTSPSDLLRVVYQTAVSTKGCFGDGTGCADKGVGVAAYQTIGANEPSIPSIFMSGGTPYLDITSITAGIPMYIYKWTTSGANCPGGGAQPGWGNGTDCATSTIGTNSYQQIAEDQYISGRVFPIGSDLYLAPGAYGSTTSPFYKWIPSGTNCPNGGASPGWGSDNAGYNVCATSSGGGIFQAIKLDNTLFVKGGVAGPPYYGSYTWGVVPSGPDSVLIDDSMSGYVYKWIPSGGAGSKGCFGDGATCAGNAVSGANTFDVLGGKVNTYAGFDVNPISINGVSYLVIASRATPIANLGYYIVKPVSIACLGNGTTCNTPAQTLQVTTPRVAKGYAMNNEQYLAVGSAANNYPGANNSKVYKWTSSGNCWGDGTTCGTPFQSLSTSGTNAISYFTQAGNSYLAFGGNGTVHPEQSPTSHIYKWMPPAAAQNPGGVHVNYYWDTALIGVNSPDDGQDPTVQHWWGGGSPIANGENWGGRWKGGLVGPAAGTYSFWLQTDDGTRVWIDDTLVIDAWGHHDNASVTYTMPSSWAANSQHSIRIEFQEFTGNAGMQLRWSYPGSGGWATIPSSALYEKGPTGPNGCWGDGYICDEPYQRMPGSFLDMESFTVPGDSTAYLMSGGPAGNTNYYKWTSGSFPCPIGGGFGNGVSTCSNLSVESHMGTDGSGGDTVTAIEPFAMGNTEYMAVSYSDGTGNRTYVYQWLPAGTPPSNTAGCFGGNTPTTLCDRADGTDHYFQMSGAGNGNSNAYNISIFNNNGTTTLAYVNDIYNVIKLLNWNSSGTGCGSGAWGNGTSTCSTSDFLSKNLQQFSAVAGGQPKSIRTLTIGSDLYMVAGISGDTYGSYIYKWIASKDCFGDGVNCGARVQGLPVGDAHKVEATTTSSGSYFIVPAQDANTVTTYKYTPAGGAVPGCILYQKGASESTYASISTGDSNSSGFSVTPTEDTNYKLQCLLSDGTIDNTILVTHLQSAPTVTVTATDNTATEVAGNTGTFTITRSASGGGGGSGTPVITSFSSNTSWTVPAGVTSVEVLVVGGGGGGGSRHGGGGGGGGVVASSAYTTTPGAVMPITVGAGGQAGWYNGGVVNYGCTGAGGPGGNSTFGTITAKGGGGGKTYDACTYVAGGSGGGGGGQGSSQSGGTATAGQGNVGGIGNPGNPAGGGGGGAGAVGGNYSGLNGGSGGNGIANSITGSSVIYAGGGGGNGADGGGIGGSGGTGGGGHGGDNGSNTNQTAGTNGLGGGGGGDRSLSGEAGAAGGSGIVIVKYTPASGGGGGTYPPLDVSYSLGGSATNGTDYQTITSPLHFADGEISKTITVTPTQDNIYEGPETVLLTIQNPGDASYIVGSPSSDTVTITDQQTSASLPSVAFAVCSSSQTPDGSVCELKITPTRVRAGSSVNVTWSVAGIVTGENGNSGDTCTIARSPAGTNFPQNSGQTSGTWVNLTGVSSTITQQTKFTLTCTAPNGTTVKSITQTILLLPSYQEI